MFPERKIYLGTGLSLELISRIIDFLKANTNCFAWSYVDMIGISLKVTFHKLILDPNFPLVKQKKRSVTEVRNKFIKEEVTRLLNIGSI